MAASHRRAEELRTGGAAAPARRALRHPGRRRHEVLYHKPARRDLQDVLTCIRHGSRCRRAGRLIRPNAEHALKSPHAFDASCSTTIRRVSRARSRSPSAARFSLDRSALPLSVGEAARRHHVVEPGCAVSRFETALEGATARRLPRGRGANQLERELELIDELDYCGYFLTMWEIVRFCREQEILCQGRGSAANSAVCYCLGITAVDPVRMGLLFERFLSRERAEPPDIDLDIEHDRREEVIQHVYASTAGATRRWWQLHPLPLRVRPCATWARRWASPRRRWTGCPSCCRTTASSTAEAFGQAGLDPELTRALAPAAAGLRGPGLSATPVDPSRRDSCWDTSRSRPGADRERLDARSHGDPVGQGLPGRAGAVQGRPAGIWERLHQLHLGFDLLERHHGETYSTMARSPRPTSAHVRHDLPRATPSACSRSRAGRRWRCCRD